MIVNTLKNSQEYQDLFVDAYRFLKENGKISADDTRETLSSINEYYGHMRDFLDSETPNYKYLMLPLEEEVFNINLDTRQITIPSSFRNHVSITQDQVAEMLVFSVDRYFDYMDLANTNIYAQWILPDASKGRSQIYIIDYDSAPDKIKFAWVLDNNITRVPGTVKFSIRFVQEIIPQEGQSQEGQTELEPEIVYSLNTLESSFIIKPALIPSLNGEGLNVENAPTGLFDRVILNSQYIHNGVRPPSPPSFGAPGMNLKIKENNNFRDLIDGDKANLNDNDTLSLSVQAVSIDTGMVEYAWYKKNSDNEENKIISEDGYEISEDYINIGKPQHKKFYERYYTYNDDNYELYTGSFPPDEDLYEKYSTLTIKPKDDNNTEGSIIGTYFARAKNVIQISDSNNNEISSYESMPRASDACTINGPREIHFTTDLEEHKFLSDDESENLLSVDVSADGNPQYAWYQTIEINDNQPIFGSPMDDNTSSIEINKIGWYKVKVISNLNRETTEENSEICRVTRSPELPEIEIEVNGSKFSDDMIRNPSTIKIIPSFDTSDIPIKLQSDTITYQWKIADPNDNIYIDIISDDSINVDNDQLIITDNFTGVKNIKCIVTNQINNRSISTTDSNKDIIFTVAIQ